MLTLSKIDAVKTKRPQERLQRYKIAGIIPGYPDTLNFFTFYSSSYSEAYL